MQYVNDSGVECFRFGSGTSVAKEDKKRAEIVIKLRYIVTIRIMLSVWSICSLFFFFASAPDG